MDTDPFIRFFENQRLMEAVRSATSTMDTERQFHGALTERVYGILGKGSVGGSTHACNNLKHPTTIEEGEFAFWAAQALVDAWLKGTAIPQDWEHSLEIVRQIVPKLVRIPAVPTPSMVDGGIYHAAIRLATRKLAKLSDQQRKNALFQAEKHFRTSANPFYLYETGLQTVEEHISTLFDRDQMKLLNWSEVLIFGLHSYAAGEPALWEKYYNNLLPTGGFAYLTGPKKAELLNKSLAMGLLHGFLELETNIDPMSVVKLLMPAALALELGNDAPEVEYFPLAEVLATSWQAFAAALNLNGRVRYRACSGCKQKLQHRRFVATEGGKCLCVNCFMKSIK